MYMTSPFAKTVFSPWANICVLFADYVSGDELFTHLYQREHFTEDQVRIYIGEIILALEHLHKVSVCLCPIPIVEVAVKAPAV